MIKMLHILSYFALVPLLASAAVIESDSDLYPSIISAEETDLRPPYVDSTSASIEKRTIYGPICVGGHTTPVVSDCQKVLGTWTSYNKTNVNLPANSCASVQYNNCFGYICATKCNSIVYDTGYVAQQLANIYGACVTSNGEAGYYHSDGGSGYAKFEIGLERYSGELTPYEPC